MERLINMKKINRKSKLEPPKNKRLKKDDMKKSNRKTQHIRIDEEDYKWIKETAYIDRISMKDLVSNLVENYREQNK